VAGLIAQNDFRRGATMEVECEFPPSLQDGFGFGMVTRHVVTG
jgi:hypothetical protein